VGRQELVWHPEPSGVGRAPRDADSLLRWPTATVAHYALSAAWRVATRGRRSNHRSTRHPTRRPQLRNTAAELETVAHGVPLPTTFTALRGRRLPVVLAIYALVIVLIIVVVVVARLTT
jgi:hypothetical protein